MRGDTLASGGRSATFITSENVSAEKWAAIWEDDGGAQNSDASGSGNLPQKSSTVYNFKGKLPKKVRQ